jgi:hypothetical protein
MTSSLATLSLQLGRVFWGVGIPTFLLAFFLLVGLRYQGRPAKVLGLFGFLALGVGSLGLPLEFIVTGEAWTISRHAGVVRKIDNVRGYWIATTFWFVLSAFLTVVACWVIIRSWNDWRRGPSATRRSRQHL